MVKANHTAEAQLLADRLENEGRAAHDDSLVAMAWLVRGAVQQWNGEAALANRLAEDARELLGPGSDPYVRYWAALSAGTTARMMSRNDDAQKALQDALALAVEAQNPYRRSDVVYQQAVVANQAKQWPRRSTTARRRSGRRSLPTACTTCRGRRTPSRPHCEFLEKPKEELDAMLESLAIARNAKSDPAESMALINLADVYLRRDNYKEVLDLSQRSLELANSLGNVFTAATNKANMGFALLGLGRIDSGKRLAEQAVAEYERAGAVAEIGDLLVEYGQHLANAGDYKGALALFHRERKLRDEVAASQREKTDARAAGDESDKRKREIELLNRERSLKSAELQNRQLQQRIWWLLAAVFALSFGVVAVLYRKLRLTNRLLASEEQRAEFPEQPRSADRALQPPPFPGLHQRRARRRPSAVAGAVDKPVQALLLIDLDHFKLINDQFGHAAGDAVLIAVARRLRDTLRETDMIVRWGGEEFLVFVPLAPRRIASTRSSQRIMNAISAEPIEYMGHYIQVTASIGYSPMPLPPRRRGARLGARDRSRGQGALHGEARTAATARTASAACCVPATTRRWPRSSSDLEPAWREGIVDMRVLLGRIRRRTPRRGSRRRRRRSSTEEALRREVATARRGRDAC